MTMTELIVHLVIQTKHWIEFLSTLAGAEIEIKKSY